MYLNIKAMKSEFFFVKDLTLDFILWVKNFSEYRNKMSLKVNHFVV